MIGAGVGVAVLFLLLVTTSMIWCQSLSNKMDQKRADELNPLTADCEKYKADVEAVKKIEVWKAGDPIWLDELRWLVSRLPDTKSVMVDEFSGKVEEGRGAEIKKLHGKALSQQTVTAIQKVLNDQGHVPSPILSKAIPAPRGGGRGARRRSSTTRPNTTVRFPAWTLPPLRRGRPLLFPAAEVRR